VRVFLINPSEVITDFARRAEFPQVDNPSKLRSEDILIKAVLEMDDRGSHQNSLFSRRIRWIKPQKLNRAPICMERAVAVVS